MGLRCDYDRIENGEYFSTSSFCRSTWLDLRNQFVCPSLCLNLSRSSGISASLKRGKYQFTRTETALSDPRLSSVGLSVLARKQIGIIAADLFEGLINWQLLG